VDRNFKQVNIGMPIYNESKHIGATIESILSQEYADFELIISDNASTDDTLNICSQFAAKDNRIRIIANPINIGAAENFKQVFEISNSQYFVWISGHDLWHPQFLSKCVAGLEDNHSVVLYYPKSVWIDEINQNLGAVGRGIDTRGLDPVSRFQVVLWGMGYASPIYGLLRSSALNQVTIGTKTVGPDNILLNELSLLGDLAYLDEPLQYVRKLADFGNWESYISKIFNQKLSEFSGVDLFWSMTYEYLKIIYKHVPDPNIRHVLSTSVVNCLLTKYRWILSSLVSSSIQSSTGEISASEQRINYTFNQLTQVGQNIESLWQDYHFSPGVGVRKLIAIDGVFFQLYSTGIARVWKSLLEEWANTEFGSHLVILDRVGTAPKIQGISYYQIPAYDYNNTDADREMLQQICSDIGAELFISTYYTTPIETPSVLMAYDMIPEVLGFDLTLQMWQEKQRGIAHASAFLTISEHTAKDLINCYPDIAPATVTPALCGVNPIFKPADSAEIESFRTQHGITKPYFLLVGAGSGYKNTILFWQGFAKLANNSDFDIVCTGAAGIGAEQYSTYAPGSSVHCLQLEDRDLNLAYAGAIALVYPSKYEGFGLPIVEALASGCPVITCRNASIPEVAGTSAIYIDDTSIEEMTQALASVQQSEIRDTLIEKGLIQATRFSWTKMAEIVRSVLTSQTLGHLQLNSQSLIVCPDWTADEEELGEELGQIFYQLSQHSNISQMSLIIATSNDVDPEAADMLISSIAMNLMMSAGIDITESLLISLTGKLLPIQWQALLPKLQGRIKLELEDAIAVETSGANLIPAIQLTELPILTLV
jgi:glycosyltransferase involved in cell wall biosynthesis